MSVERIVCAAVGLLAVSTAVVTYRVTNDSGAVGPRGFAGLDGPAGKGGVEGPTGPSGAPGDRGATGPSGFAGPQGAPGATGPAGSTGPPGFEGFEGSISDFEILYVDGALTSLGNADAVDVAFTACLADSEPGVPVGPTYNFEPVLVQTSGAPLVVALPPELRGYGALRLTLSGLQVKIVNTASGPAQSYPWAAGLAADNAASLPSTTYKYNYLPFNDVGLSPGSLKVGPTTFQFVTAGALEVYNSMYVQWNYTALLRSGVDFNAATTSFQLGVSAADTAYLIGTRVVQASIVPIA